MSEKLKSFNINIDDIEISYQYMEDIKQAIEKMQNNYDVTNIEIVLNKNLISVFDKIKNIRALFGCRVSFDNLDKDISFIVREDTKPSYEELEQQLKDKDEKISKVKEYIKENVKAELLNGSIWIDKYKLIEILESE